MDKEKDSLSPFLQRLSRNRGDQEAWTTLYERMWGFVLAIVFRTLKGEPPEDVAQDVFIRVARYCPFQKLQTGDAFRAYLWKVARNECYSRLRKRQREGAGESATHDVAEPVADLARDFESRELYDWVTEELTAQDKEILRLTDEGFSSDEIAKALDISAGNVTVRRHRAREAVRKFMKENGLVQ